MIRFFLGSLRPAPRAALSLLHVFVFASLTSNSWSQVTPRLVEIGDVAPNSVNATYYSLQSHGRSVLTQFRFWPELEVRVWDHGDGVTAFSLGSGSSVAVLSDASDTGEEVAYTYHPTGTVDGSLWRGIRRDAAGNLEFLEAPASAFGGTLARLISGDGSTVVGGFQSAPNVWELSAWDAQGNMQPLGDLPGGGVDGYYIGVSDDGSTITGFSNSGIECDQSGCHDSYDPFWWTQALGMRPLATLAPNLVPRDLSGDGTTIVGYISDPMTGSRDAARYRFGHAEETILVGSAGFLCTRDGSIIVGEAYDAPIPGHPNHSGHFVWFEGQGAFTLTDVLSSAGAALPPGVEVERVRAISPEGNALLLEAGPGGVANRAYVAYIDTPSLPLGDSHCGPANLNSTGTPGVLVAEGFGFAEGPGLTLQAGNLPPGATCLFLASQTDGFIAMPGGSQGNLCLAGSIGRFYAPSEVQVTDAAGRAALWVNPSFIPQPNGRVIIAPGETWRFQAWYRDVNPGATSNFTDSIAETF